MNLDPSAVSETTYFHVNYAAKIVAPKDVIITMAVDPQALTDFNADPSNPIKFELFPDSIYSFKNIKDTVKAGQNYSEGIGLVLNSNKINFTKNYLLPISIKDAQGNNISGNFGTIYFHIIGNPIAGKYNWDFTRYNTIDGSGSKSTSSFTGISTSFRPDDPFTIEVPSGYFINPRYVISFDNNGGVLSNFNVSFNSDDAAALKAASVVTITPPYFSILDPANKIFEIKYVVQSPSGYRNITDKYYK